jgi:hypothetical protein
VLGGWSEDSATAGGKADGKYGSAYREGGVFDAAAWTGRFERLVRLAWDAFLAHGHGGGDGEGGHRLASGDGHRHQKGDTPEGAAEGEAKSYHVISAQS